MSKIVYDKQLESWVKLDAFGHSARHSNFQVRMTFKDEEESQKTFETEDAFWTWYFLRK